MRQQPSETGEPHAWPQLSPSAYYGLAGEIVAAIEPHSEADPAALLIQLVVAFGSVIGRGSHFVVEADNHYTNLFVVLVGQTSKGRKGSSLGHVRRLLRAIDEKWDGDRVDFGLSSGEGLIWAVRDPIKKEKDGKEVIDDDGVSDKRLLVVEAEFASTLRVLAREGNTLSPIIRNAWDTGDLHTLVKNSPARATGAHISIIGHVTADELCRYLTRTEAGNGFANRILWACVRRSKMLPDGGQIQRVDFAPLVKRLRSAVAFAQEARQLARDQDGRLLWQRLYPRLSAEKVGLFGSIVARAEAQVTRLSVLYALLDGSPVITREHLLAASALWDYCEASARFIFGAALGDSTADEILRTLRATGSAGMTRTEISQSLGRHKSSDEIERALGVIQRYALAGMQAEDTDGRRAERWFASYPGEKSELSERTGTSGATEGVISLSSLNSQADTAREDTTNPGETGEEDRWPAELALDDDDFADDDASLLDDSAFLSLAEHQPVLSVEAQEADEAKAGNDPLVEAEKDPMVALVLNTYPGSRVIGVRPVVNGVAASA